MQRILQTAIALLLVTVSVCPAVSCSDGQGMQSETYYDMFDTFVTVMAYERDADVFEENCKKIKNTLWECSVLFDIYREYDGYNNLCTVNKNAGKSPVKVDARIIELIEYSKEMYKATSGKINIAMGSVLGLWHECREQNTKEPGSAPLPSSEALEEADRHTDIEKVKVDREAMSVYLEDGGMSLDVGAVAKGFAADEVIKMLRSDGITDGYAVNIGGNLMVLGERQGGFAWQASVKSPYEDKAERIARIEMKDASLVTSGIYERYFTVDGERYHHIIDPQTLYPSEHFDSVSVLGENSMQCDALSTALFCMTQEEGQALIAELDGVEALWVKDSRIIRSAGFPKDAPQTEQ